MVLNTIIEALAASPLSVAIGAHEWVTPAIQTVHILAIAVLMAAVLMTNLRALEVTARDETMQRMSRGYTIWMGVALAVLLLSGLTLIIGEPRRSLENNIFYLKMGLLLGALLLTFCIHAPLRRDGEFWSAPRRIPLLRLLACGALILWVGIIFAGRWIAYV